MIGVVLVYRLYLIKPYRAFVATRRNFESAPGPFSDLAHKQGSSKSLRKRESRLDPIVKNKLEADPTDAS
jgi:hypothetical protein